MQMKMRQVMGQALDHYHRWLIAKQAADELPVSVAVWQSEVELIRQARVFLTQPEASAFHAVEQELQQVEHGSKEGITSLTRHLQEMQVHFDPTEGFRLTLDGEALLTTADRQTICKLFTALML